MKQWLWSDNLIENDLRQLEQVASRFAPELKPGDVVYLEGSLGAGKTTCCQALLKALGVQEHVTSPTFTLVNEYVTTQGLVIYHWDLYRLKNAAELFDVGLEEYFREEVINIIEWPDKGAPYLPQANYEMVMQGPPARMITCYHLS